MSEDEDSLQVDPREADIREEQLLEALSEEATAQQLIELLQNEPVRDLLWRILTKCHVFNSTYSKNFGDMALNEGMRQVGLWLIAEIGAADPQALLAMQMKANLLAQKEKLRQVKTKATRRARRD